MVVLEVFMEWYEAARGQTRTTETVVFVTQLWKMYRVEEIMERNGRNREKKSKVIISSISTKRGSVGMCRHCQVPTLKSSGSGCNHWGKSTFFS